MQSHSQKLAQLKAQLAEQSSGFRDICRVLEGLDSRALLPVSEQLLEEIDTACSQSVASPMSNMPMRGVRV